MPRQLHRMTIDGKVFREKAVRDYGVAILVDVSGSMSISEHDLERILRECPAAMIAIYGSDHYCKNGYLKVNVENKMRIDGAMKGEFGGGNVVDVPAIEWLAKRKEQRKIWICDGGVTGRGDGPISHEEMRHLIRTASE